ncbi:HU family DNA-binding protein [Bacteroides reticulotermitis]|uniref:HU domain-containing protein n=2 Tax=Bacteroides reticulotermitis TaxID=1133319 RepID=W4V1J9_9BACE|nr:HU family DNA-binding protein [Bacteroides reticulotermitis]MBB4042255.1 putative histone-like DNA-binding protein [Bacteroides reticulotermitis]GAE86678.1 hypothetical protein JCM10512_5217 [Bacteroides reticulotermitis JCM 10512]
MAKVFPFTSVLRRNMLEKEKPDLYYALAKRNGEVDINELAERIQRSCTVNWADVLCVLRALQTEMIESFRKGEVVRLGDLGSFFVTLRSSGTLILKDVKEGIIKGARVRFRPGKEIKDAMKTLTYSKFKQEGEKEDPEDPGDGGGEAPDPTI